MNWIKKLNWTQWVALFIFASMAVSLVFTVFEIFTAPVEQPVHGPKVTLQSDYIFLLVEIILGILILALPSILARSFKFEIPGLVYLLFIIFLYGSIYLGTIQKFYSIVPYWDKILHIFSGAMLGAIGFSFVSLLNFNENVVLKMKPGFVAVFFFFVSQSHLAHFGKSMNTRLMGYLDLTCNALNHQEARLMLDGQHLLIRWETSL
ncbi:hypothetical protein MAQA_01662 [Listeria aquatica FSL S10-1188]|uniref:Uncharacterized protein n=1 Tax=Listeria aquatica FSL S10-1188 TaxID=1265818 RepID=W7B9N3_9LIST|nr:hypothetical protein MAQA_01662 [Listeria aquatica FSL S10-1188]